MSSYYSEEMLEATSHEAEAALARTVDWMARQSLNNMLHVNPDAAAVYGGSEKLLAKLRAGYVHSLAEAN